MKAAIENTEVNRQSPVNFSLQKQAMLLMSQWLTAKAHNLLVCLDDCGLYLFGKFWKFLGDSDKKNKNLTLAH